MAEGGGRSVERSKSALEGRRKVLKDFCVVLEEDTELLLFAQDVNDVKNANPLSIGTFMVKKATLHATELVAAKTLLPNCNAVERFVTECNFVLQIVRSSYHPNILKMFGFVYDPLKFGECPYLIMECMEMTLTQFIKRKSTFYHVNDLSNLKLHIARDIANGLCSKFLHGTYADEKCYIHCSLTCDNILLTAGRQAKISNFTRVKEENQNFTLSETYPELRYYLPPEVSIGTSKTIVAKKCVDMYAFAKIAYYIATDTCPLDNPEEGYSYDKEKFGNAATNDRQHHCLRQLFEERVLKHENPESRISAKQAFDDLNTEIGPVIRPELALAHGSLHTTSDTTDSSFQLEIPSQLRTEVPSDSEIVDIAYNYVHKWPKLAATLGFSDIETEEISDKYKDEPSLQKLAMLRKWYDKNPRKATVENLLNAMYRTSRVKDAMNVLRLIEENRKKGGSSKSGSILVLPTVIEDSQEIHEENPSTTRLSESDQEQTEIKSENSEPSRTERPHGEVSPITVQDQGGIAAMTGSVSNPQQTDGCRDLAEEQTIAGNRRGNEQTQTGGARIENRLRYTLWHNYGFAPDSD